MKATRPADQLPRNESEYWAFIAARAANPVMAAQDAALLEYACTMLCPRNKPKRADATMTRLPENILAALTVTHRAAGWNFRSADTIRFDLPNDDGTACRLLVVPYRRWACSHWERRAAWSHDKRGGRSG